MTDFIYGVINWTYLGGQYAAKGGIAVHRKSLAAFQQYRDRRTQADAPENLSTLLRPLDELAEYEYEPIKSSSCIRILSIEPGCLQDPLQCSLQELDLDSHAAFNALSYCWGEAGDNQNITCNDRKISIRRNLHNALVRLRQKESALRIWVDALCINQKDKTEKRQQILLMRRIYQQCQTCFAWLGDHVESDALAFKLLHLIQDYLTSHPSDRRAKVFLPTKILAKYSTTPGEWEALSALFTRPWFERVWTLEEIVLPRHAMLTSGKFSFDAQHFFEAIDFVHQSELDALISGSRAGYLQSLKVATMRTKVHERSADIDLLDTLRTARDRDAYDARDKVMGVLGMSRKDTDWSSSLGYHMSPAEIFVSTATHFLESEDPMRLLQACNPASSEVAESTSSLPSWVPDWSDRVTSVPCILDFEQNETYRAGGLEPPALIIQGTLNTGSQLLRIRGKRLSSLKFTIDRNSNKLKQAYMDAHHPHRSTCEKIGDWYFYIAIAWMFDCWDDVDTSRPKMTIEQFFLAACWSVARASCSEQDFWQTLECALTNERKTNALKFQSQVMTYAKDEHQHDVDDPVQSSFLHNLNDWCQVRKFCVTVDGLVGWVPLEAQAGDVVCLFQGSNLPYLLRGNPGDSATYQLIGHCFIQGVMDGEAMANPDLPLEEVVIR